MSRDHVPNSRPRKSGEYEIAPTPCAAHHGRTSCRGRPQDAVRRLSEWSGTPVARHSSSCATEKFDTPIARILPASAARARAGGFGDRLRHGPVQLVEIDVVDAEPPQARVALRDDLARAAAERVGASMLAPRPNFVKTSGRRDAGSSFNARPDDLSECPEP